MIASHLRAGEVERAPQPNTYPASGQHGTSNMGANISCFSLSMRFQEELGGEIAVLARARIATSALFVLVLSWEEKWCAQLNNQLIGSSSTFEFAVPRGT
jgi:hypothetical protein